MINFGNLESEVYRMESILKINFNVHVASMDLRECREIHGTYTIIFVITWTVNGASASTKGIRCNCFILQLISIWLLIVGVINKWNPLLSPFPSLSSSSSSFSYFLHLLSFLLLINIENSTLFYLFHWSFLDLVLNCLLFYSLILIDLIILKMPPSVF